VYQTDDDAETAQGRGSAAGGFRTGTELVVPAGTDYTITVGAGGRKPDLKLDPRGDLGKTADPAEVQAYVDKFKAAFDLDAEEKDIAFAVLDIHQTIICEP
jgi:hypothetical protein